MIELTESHFRELCADETVRHVIDNANRNGRRASLGFWGLLILGPSMMGALTWLVIASGWLVTGVLIGSFGILFVYIIATIPLAMAGRGIKLPVFERLAARHGLAYAPLVEAPLFYAEARPALFGEEPGVESFTDYFQGKLLDACDFATCQAYLLPGGGGRFNGRLFAFARQRVGIGQVVVTPDCPRWVNPATALAFDDDPAFDRAFRIYATDETDGRALLGPEARRLLLELRRRGKVRLHASPEAIFVAFEGRKGFTPGLGFFFSRGEDRVRAMFDDLADSLRLLAALKAGLD